VPERQSSGEVTIDVAQASDFARIVEALTAVGLPTEDLAPAAVGHFLLARRGRTVLGAVAVEPYGDAGLLRSLVVDSAARGGGVGAALVAAAEQRAAREGVRTLALLTQTAAGFFARLGYAGTPRAQAPAAVQASSEFRHLCPACATCLVKQLGVPQAPATVANVLFLCTGNSARSILAEAILNGLGAPRFRAHSAGSHPSGRVNPFALELLRRQGLPTEGLRSKAWDEFAAPGAPHLDFVFTVCDAAAGEACPVWPGQPISAHWGVTDPAAVTGSDEEKRRAFFAAYTTLRNRIQLFLSLPHTTLDRMKMKQRLDAIGSH